MKKLLLVLNVIIISLSAQLDQNLQTLHDYLQRFKAGLIPTDTIAPKRQPSPKPAAPPAPPPPSAPALPRGLPKAPSAPTTPSPSPKKSALERTTSAQIERPKPEPTGESGSIAEAVAALAKRRRAREAADVQVKRMPGTSAEAEPFVRRPLPKVAPKPEGQLDLSVDVDLFGYIPLPKQASSFGKPIKFNAVEIPRATTQVQSLLDSDVTLAEGELKIDTAKLGSAAQSAQKIIQTVQDKLKPVSSVDPDQRDLLFNNLALLLLITPADSAKNIAEGFLTLAEATQVPPSKCFNYITGSYIGIPLIKAYEEVEREKWNLVTLAIGVGSRTAQLKKIAEKMAQTLNAINVALSLYEKVQDNSSIWRLDRDLFASGIKCAWSILKGLREKLESVIGTQDFARFLSIQIEEKLLGKLFDEAESKVNSILPDTTFNLLDLLTILYQESRQPEADTDSLSKALMLYLPEESKARNLKISAKRIDQIVELNKLARSGMVAHCNADHFETADELSNTLGILEAVKGKAPRQDAVKNFAQQLQTTFAQKEKEKQDRVEIEEIKKPLEEIRQRLDKDIEAATDPDKIEKVIEDVEGRRNIKQESKKEIIEGLRQRKSIIERSQSLATVLGTALCDICTRGEMEPIKKMIKRDIYENERYKEPTITKTDPKTKRSKTEKIAEEDKPQVQAMIIQSVIAYLLKSIKEGKIQCPICTYDGAWLLAQDLKNQGQSTLNEWTRRLLNLPYNKYSIAINDMKDLFK